MTSTRQSKLQKSIASVIPAPGVTPFHFTDIAARGKLVRLGFLTDITLDRHAYPAEVKEIAGQTLALVAGLSSSLKLDGALSLQIKGDGPINLIVAECNNRREMRFYAKYDDSFFGPIRSHSRPTAQQLLGQGHIALTVDIEKNAKRYQGIVSIHGQTIGDMAMQYCSQSEQLETWINLVCHPTEGGWRACALILEKMVHNIPSKQHKQKLASQPPLRATDDGWATLLALASTITSKELLDDCISSEKLLHRLFHSTDIVINPLWPLTYGCNCSHQRLGMILSYFPRQDLRDIASREYIILTCKFCHATYSFDPAQILSCANPHTQD